MSIVAAIALSAWVGVCGVWAGLIVAQRRARRDGLLLDCTDASDIADCGGRVPSVCVVVAARNESAGISRCIEHLLDQDYPELTVLIVDDRSDDDTLAVAQRCARTDNRVRVLHIDQLPPGWLAKSHALWQGARTAGTDWLLFTDVDCTLNRCAVGRAVREAHDRTAQLLTLWPRQSPGGFWEHTLIPLCGGIIALWFGSSRINNPDSHAAFANGQFILFDRNCYLRIGGHAAVRSAIIEDVPLAEHAKRSGVRCWAASGRDLFAVRMYGGYRAIRDGWSRIFVGALRSPTKIAASMAWLIVGSLLPYIAVIVLAVSIHSVRSAGGPVGWMLKCAAVICAGHLTLMMMTSYRFWTLGGCRRLDLIWYPLSVCVVIRILARSWWCLVMTRRIVWRSTYYRIDAHARVTGCDAQRGAAASTAGGIGRRGRPT